MDSSIIRQKFLLFFEKKGHKIIPSSSLIPADNSVLFTSAGMQQFKSCFLGEDCSFPSRVTSCQKCFRTSDIKEVGDGQHLTFLEMLGNFSFGDYFKKEAMEWALEFFIEECGLDFERLWVTYFKGEGGFSSDEESKKRWIKLGFPEKRIRGLGRDDNFWGPTGKSGPCGPTAEVYYDLEPEYSRKGQEDEFNDSPNRFVEIGNLVFNQYHQDEEGKISKLKQEGIDTGIGLERLAMIVQNKESIFKTDLFFPLLQEIRKESKNSDLLSERIIADHIRAIVFLIAAGVSPSNLGRGYVLRRITRRMIEATQKISFSKFAYKKLISLIIKQYQIIYPNLEKIENHVLAVIQTEEKRIEKISQKGLSEFDKLKTKNISGEKAFYLYATHGLSLIQIKEKGYNFSENDFIKAKEEHQKISRQGAEKKFGGHGITKKGVFSEAEKKKIRLHTATHLLQAALRKVLGLLIKQKGSNINEERLRFDFSFNRKLTTQEIIDVEEEVNRNIKNDLLVECQEMLLSEAVEDGALTIEGANYPKRVNVYVIQKKDQEIISKEVCIGPHTKSILELGHFSILKEESVGAGIRRIKAILD